eukprot:scaffold15453_cov110-Isochrysis_galbana.AAC.2
MTRSSTWITITDELKLYTNVGDADDELVHVDARLVSSSTRACVSRSSAGVTVNRSCERQAST